MRLILWVLTLTWPVSALAGLAPPAAAPGPGLDLPEPLRSFAGWVFSLQRELNGEMRQHLGAIKESGAWEPVAALVLAAFLYGIFHAVGPGHGKVVIGGWFATRRVPVLEGLGACCLAALVQAGAAVALVGIPAGLLSLAPRDIMGWAAWLEVFSYGLIAILGLVMGWRTLKGHTCSHEHHHHGDGCGHHHHHETGRSSLMMMAAAVGFRPCSGAILVLLFTLANGLFMVGIAATFAMGAGVALTVSGIGLGALGLNRLLDAGFTSTRHAELARKGLGVAGAAAITLLGVVLLAGAIANGPQLTG